MAMVKLITAILTGTAFMRILHIHFVIMDSVTRVMNAIIAVTESMEPVEITAIPHIHCMRIVTVLVMT